MLTLMVSTVWVLLQLLLKDVAAMVFIQNASLCGNFENPMFSRGLYNSNVKLTAAVSPGAEDAPRFMD